MCSATISAKWSWFSTQSHHPSKRSKARKLTKQVSLKPPACCSPQILEGLGFEFGEVAQITDDWEVHFDQLLDWLLWLDDDDDPGLGPQAPGWCALLLPTFQTAAGLVARPFVLTARRPCAGLLAALERCLSKAMRAAIW